MTNESSTLLPKQHNQEINQSSYTITDFLKEFSIGCVNTLICIPVLFAFATIVYSHDFFTIYRPVLVRLLLWSSVLHQITMTIVSSMNFSVCQVQDAGLLFLGAMATKIADTIISECSSPHTTSNPTLEPYSYECTSSVLSTTLFTIALSTSLLGIALMVISSKGLARVINYLPLSVISAYLAYIGALLFTAGVSISSNYSLAVPHDLFSFFYNHYPKLIYILPSWCLALLLMYIQRKYPSPLTLPLSLLSIPIIFYLFSFTFGFSLQDLRDIHLVSQPHEENGNIIQYLTFQSIHFKLVPTVFVEWVLMVLVVAFSSSLDIISIELELAQPLDINQELWSVGVSNAINGLAGGATGSYIFSQTIFTAKSKPKSRLPGIVNGAIEAIVLFLSFDLTAYLPSLWFATTITYIGLELMNEWVLQRRHKVQSDDYIISLVTFIAILFINLQYGLFIGVLCALIHFIYIYSSNGFVIEVSHFLDSTLGLNLPHFLRPILHRDTLSTTHISYDNSNDITQLSTTTLQSTLTTTPQFLDSFRSQLQSEVYILELSGHIRFMTAPRLLDKIQLTIKRYQAHELKQWLLNFQQIYGGLQQQINITSQSDDIIQNDMNINNDSFNGVDYDPFDGGAYDLDRETTPNTNMGIDSINILPTTPSKRSKMKKCKISTKSTILRSHSKSNDYNTFDLYGDDDEQDDIDPAQYINPTIIIDFSSVTGFDSSAIHNTKLLINACSQTFRQPSIHTIYQELLLLEPNFNLSLPKHLQSTLPTVTITKAISCEATFQSDLLSSTSSTQPQSPTITTITTTSPLLNHINSHSSPTISLTEQQSIMQSEHPTFTTTFDLLFTSLPSDFIQLFKSNNIPFFNSSIGNEELLPSITSSPIHNNSIDTLPPRPSSSIGLISTTTISPTSTLLARTTSNSSDTTTIIDGQSTSISPFRSIAELSQFNSSSTSLSTSNINIYQAQLEIASLFNLDSHLTPSFLAPIYTNNHNTINNQPPTTIATILDENEVNPKEINNNNNNNNTQPIQSNHSNGTPSPIIIAYYEDVSQAKIWAAAKLYYSTVATTTTQKNQA